LKETAHIDLDKMTPEEMASYLPFLDAAVSQDERLNPLLTFVPNGKIEEVVNAVGEDQDKWIFILASANSVGKTAGTINILGNIIWGPQNEWFHGPRYTAWNSPKKIWYISEQSSLKDFIVGTDLNGPSEFHKWFPAGRFTCVKSGYDYISRISTDNGWTITFKTFDMDASKFESDKVGVIVFDEPPPESIFNAALSRLTLGGIVIMPMTPLFQSAWVKNRLVDSSLPHVFLLTAHMHANCKQCSEQGKPGSKRGRLDHDWLLEWASQFDPEEREARENGTFAHLVGLVYQNIHPTYHRHNYPADHFNQEEYRIYCAIDPHDRKPPAIGWFAVDRYENGFAIDEFPFCPDFKPFNDIKAWPLKTEENCEWIRKKELANGWEPQKIVRVMDPNWGRKPDQTIGLTTQEIYAKIGRKMNYPLNFSLNVNDDLKAGHRLVRDSFALNPDNQTRFKIGMMLHNTWHALTNYAYVERQGKALDAKGISENVGEKFKDFTDPSRYFWMFFKKPSVPKKEQEEIHTLDDLVYKKILPRVRAKANKTRRNWSQI
jgi:phage terminase large subunit-like protein